MPALRPADAAPTSALGSLETCAGSLVSFLGADMRAAGVSDFAAWRQE